MNECNHNYIEQEPFLICIKCGKELQRQEKNLKSYLKYPIFLSPSRKIIEYIPTKDSKCDTFKNNILIYKSPWMFYKVNEKKINLNILHEWGDSYYRNEKNKKIFLSRYDMRDLISFKFLFYIYDDRYTFNTYILKMVTTSVLYDDIDKNKKLNFVSFEEKENSINKIKEINSKLDKLINRINNAKNTRPQAKLGRTNLSCDVYENEKISLLGESID